MKKLYIYLLLISSPLFLTSCVEDITPDFELEEQVFISGLLTNEEGFVTLQIQKTVQVADTSLGAVNSAQVSLFTKDTLGEISLISDSFQADNGLYTSSEMIAPIIGDRSAIRRSNRTTI